MKRQHFILLVVLLVVLGGGALFLFQRGQQSWQQAGAGAGQKVLGEFDVNNVARIVVAQSTNTVTLAKGDTGWVVKERGDYPANFDEIRDSIRKLAELKVVQTTQVGASQRPRLELTEPGTAGATNSGTKVELLDSAGKPLRSFLLGKMVMRQGGQPSPFGGEGGYPIGRYVLTLPAGDSVAIVSDTLTGLDSQPSRWINKEFVKIEKIRSIALTAPESTNSWTLSRDAETNAWALADATADEKLDNNKVGGVTGAFAAASFDDVLASKTGDGLPKATKVVFTTFDGFTYDLHIGEAQGDSYPLTVAVTGNFATTRTVGADEKPEEKTKLDQEFADQKAKLEQKLKQEQAFAGRTFLVSKWTIEALLKTRGELLETKPAPAPPAE